MTPIGAVNAHPSAGASAGFSSGRRSYRPFITGSEIFFGNHSNMDESQQHLSRLGSGKRLNVERVSASELPTIE
jgi:hypothetical protein